MWPHFLDLYMANDRYQAATSRDIAIVLLRFKTELAVAPGRHLPNVLVVADKMAELSAPESSNRQFPARTPRACP
jgi:hypothetical protein